MKKIILLTLISFILNGDITLSPSAIALQDGKIKITATLSSTPGTGKVPAIVKIKTSEGEPITLPDCGNFPSYTDGNTAVTIECPLVDTIPEGTYAIVAVDSTNKVSDGTNDLKSITPYKKEIEPNVPDKRNVLQAIKKLSSIVGKDNMYFGI